MTTPRGSCLPRRTAQTHRVSVLSGCIGLCAVLGCNRVPEVATAGPDAQERDLVTISVVGTNDLHGHIAALPILGGYLANLRRARARDAGAVVLIDGGDMFQGTLASNLEEGTPVVAAYNLLGYDAVAIGNHEFDYGPIGPDVTVSNPRQDPRGALRARMAQAHYPFVSANIHPRSPTPSSGVGVASVLVERAGVTIGIIGASTESTPQATIAANVADLDFTSMAEAITDQARQLRSRGATMVVVAAHAGGECQSFDEPDNLSSCDLDSEIAKVAAALPNGSVDVIVAGHTHKAIAHRIGGTAVIESYALGQAFGRVDVVIDRARGSVQHVHIYPPQSLCSTPQGDPDQGLEACAPDPYEGAPIRADERVAGAISSAIRNANGLRQREIGPTLVAEFGHAYRAESALGNLFTDLMLASHPEHDAALITGGGLRASLPAGHLTYGALYEAFPFDNRFATVRLSGRALSDVFARMLASNGSFVSMAGLRVHARCDGPDLRADLVRLDGTAVDDDEVLSLVTTDFLATGGDHLFAETAIAVAIGEGPPVREQLATVLGSMKTLSPSQWLQPGSPRIRFSGSRPLACP